MSTTTDNSPAVSAKVHSLHHVNVPVSSREQTIDWYGKVFGMKLVTPPSDPNYRPPNPNGLYLTSADENFDLHFNVVGEDTERIARVASGMHFAFEVEDFEGFVAHLEELGIEHNKRGGTAATRNAGFAGQSVTASFRDPDGYLVEVMYHYNRTW
jgi:lactoylglutathione lyase